MWGMNDSVDGGAGFDASERNLGRRFALVREYKRMDDSFGTARELALAKSGHSMVVSIRAKYGSSYVKYSTIVSGKADGLLLRALTRLNALPTRTYVIFQHEADSSTAKYSCTTPTDRICGPQFVAAWTHVFQLAKAHNLDNLRWVWTVTNWGFSPQTHVRNRYYWVGLTRTHWIGIDAYNGGCGGAWYGSFKEMLANSIKWTNVHAPTRPIMLPEWGATEGSSRAAKKAFFDDVPRALRTPGYQNIRALAYWNVNTGSCNFRVDSTGTSYHAYKRLGLKMMMRSQEPGP
jgi:hypothetical protein